MCDPPVACTELGYALGGTATCVGCNVVDIAPCRDLGWRLVPFAGEPVAVWGHADTAWLIATDGIHELVRGTWHKRLSGTYFAIEGAGEIAWAIATTALVRLPDGKAWDLPRARSLAVAGKDVYVGGDDQVLRVSDDRTIVEQLPAAGAILALHVTEDGIAIAGGDGATPLWWRGADGWRPYPHQPRSRVLAIAGTNADDLLIVTGEWALARARASGIQYTEVPASRLARYGTGAIAFDHVLASHATFASASGRTSPIRTPRLRQAMWDASRGRAWAVASDGIYTSDGTSYLATGYDYLTFALTPIAGDVVAAYHGAQSTHLASLHGASPLVGWAKLDSQRARSAWSAGANDHWFVTASGGLASYHLAARYLPRSFPLTGLRAIAGRDVTDLLAVGDGGTAYRGSYAPATDTEAWTAVSLPGGIALRAVTPSARGYYVVGDAGGVFEHLGAQWRTLRAPGTGPTLRAVTAIGDHLVAVGDGGTVVRCDGTTCTDEVVPGVASLLGVTTSGRDDVFAVGDAAVVHFDGASWTPVALGDGVPHVVLVDGEHVWFAAITDSGTGRLEGVIRAEPW